MAALLASLLVVSAGPPAEPEAGSVRLPAPVFAVDFDGSDATADVAVGSPKATPQTYGKAEKELRFVPGRRGQGLLIGRGLAAVCYGRGNLPLAAGTWLVWFRPQDWAIGKEVRNLLFLVQPVPDRGYFGVQKDFEITPDGVATFGVWLSRFPGERGSSIRYRAPGFAKDCWHLAALRWRGRRFWVSIDDGPPGELRRRHPLRVTDTSGVTVYGSPFSRERTVIDDVCIYDRCLSHSQVRRIWQGQSVTRGFSSGNDLKLVLPNHLGGHVRGAQQPGPRWVVERKSQQP